MTTATNLCRYPPPARGRSRYVRNALRGRCRRSRGESRARSFLRSADGPSFALLQACSCACAVTSPLFFFLFSAHICFSLPPPERLSASLVAVFLSIFAPPPYFVRLSSAGLLFVVFRSRALEERRSSAPVWRFWSGQILRAFGFRYDSLRSAPRDGAAAETETPVVKAPAILRPAAATELTFHSLSKSTRDSGKAPTNTINCDSEHPDVGQIDTFIEVRSGWRSTSC